MSKCQICGEKIGEFAWQPFGPADSCRDDDAFMAPGSHYRGFPVLKICWNCKGELQNGENVSFTYQKMNFEARGEGLFGPFPSPYNHPKTGE